jgi:predicted TIM-barrel fold metal-dependent hydrolase
MSALLKLSPLTQVVYGSDYPYVGMDVKVIVFSQLGLDVQVVLQI